MNRKLVFAFYVNNEFHDKINDIHFECIKKFSDCFDEADINFILDKEYPKHYLLEAEKRFSEIFLGKNISFSMYDNTEYRESIIFRDKVARRLKDEDLVFFAHNKGTTNVKKYNREQIYTWVTAMYFYSLNYMSEVVQQLYNQKYYSYGPFLTKNEEKEKANKYGWYYIGTYFWINGKKLWQYMQNEGIQLPEMGDRFYAEEFLGNIIQTWPYIMTGSHETRYLVNCNDYYNHTTDYLPYLHDTETDGFNEFYKNIVG